MTDFLPIPPATPQKPPLAPRDTALLQAAQQLEATFLAEMLKSAGFGEQDNSFSGGVGEDQFASFQRQALAENMAKGGGIGLAEQFYRSMMEASDDK